MIKAVLWDLDGTLIDSEAIHYRAIIEANNKIGLILEENFVRRQVKEPQQVAGTGESRAPVSGAEEYL